MRSFYLIVLLPLVVLSCGKRGKVENIEAEPLDTIPAVVEVEPTKLPDSAFASADIVKYTIAIADTTMAGTFGTLKDYYADTPGAFTFRKGLERRADFGGSVKGNPTTIEVDWVFNTASDNRETNYGRWGGGTGWTGQPLYVEWPDSCMTRFRSSALINPEAGNKEIIVGSLASEVYFIDFNTGKPSREPIPVCNPVKGTVSLDPTLNGNLYVGLGIPAERPFGTRVIDLYKGAVTFTHPEDHTALRHWDAYDSSPLRIDRFLLWPGENGKLYKFIVEQGRLRLHSSLRYTVNGVSPGIESSMAVYRNYGYIGDNHGHLICVNLETLKPIWYYYVGDDIDATTVVTVEAGKPYVYAACEVDRRGTGPSYLVKVDALNGTEVWKAGVDGANVDVFGKHFNGGYFATPLPGTGDCEDLIFVNCVLNLNGQNGAFIAFNRATGHEVYRTPLKCYGWSSPVSFLNEDGVQYVVAADALGAMYLIHGRTGEIITRQAVGNNFESSPVVVGNSLVVGSRGNGIYKVSIK